MSISTITVDGGPVVLVAIPATPGLSDIEWNIVDGVGVASAIFAGQKQAMQWHGGDMLSGTAYLPPLAQADADNWIAFLEELRGTANAFQLYDPAQPNGRGSGAGTPLVDDTQNNGNPAGSQALGSKGWTPNAQGVLWVGDWIQVGYRLYRVLGQVNADSSGNAVISICPSLREQPTDGTPILDGIARGWTNATGTATKFKSGTLGGYTAGVLWSDFSAPTTALPADAVIQGIFPVIIASGIFDICFQYLIYGDGISFSPLSPSGAGFTAPYYTNPISPGASFASTEFYDLGSGVLAGKGIGSSLDDLVGQGILMELDSSLLDLSIDDAIAATGVGFAIYYTSATPSTDTLMPAPFSVPAGQGLTWSVPLAVEVAFTVATGTASGTAASNGTAPPLGLFRLTDNKRDWRADFGRATGIAFPFQEYR